MAIKKYYDSDCNLGVLDGKTVAVIGFGIIRHRNYMPVTSGMEYKVTEYELGKFQIGRAHV